MTQNTNSIKTQKDPAIQRVWKNNYTKRMREKGWFYLCRWIKIENKENAIKALEKLNR
jgi:hypothetical protein